MRVRVRRAHLRTGQPAAQVDDVVEPAGRDGRGHAGPAPGPEPMIESCTAPGRQPAGGGADQLDERDRALARDEPHGRDEPQRAVVERAAGSAGPQASRSMPFGRTDTSAPNTSRTRDAASLLTALSAAGVRAPAGAADDGAQRSDDPSSMQCHVIAVGRRRSSAMRAPSNANGETTPACTCTTSGSRRAQGLADQAGADGVDGQLEREARTEPVDVDAVLDVDHPAALPGLAERRGQHVHLVPGGDLAGREVRHLRLDPAGARRVAVGDVA